MTLGDRISTVLKIEADVKSVLGGSSFTIVVKTALVETSVLSVVAGTERIEAMCQACIVTEQTVKAIVDFFGFERSWLVLLLVMMSERR
jgi:hypothetical protein